jgi:hypothetical protein
VDELTDLLETKGDLDEAAAAQKTLYNILAARGVLPRVLEEIDKRRQALEGAAKPYKKGRGKNASLTPRRSGAGRRGPRERRRTGVRGTKSPGLVRTQPPT